MNAEFQSALMCGDDAVDTVAIADEVRQLGRILVTESLRELQGVRASCWEYAEGQPPSTTQHEDAIVQCKERLGGLLLHSRRAA